MEINGENIMIRFFRKLFHLFERDYDVFLRHQRAKKRWAEMMTQMMVGDKEGKL